MEKVITLMTDNLEEMIPDLPKLKDAVKKITEKADNQGSAGDKTKAIAVDAQTGVEELKGEFEYMKTRFSPQFVQRVDKALNKL